MDDSQKNQDLLVDVEAWPNDVGILEWVGGVCVTLACEQEAGKFLKKLLTIEDHPDARVGLARLSLKNGNLDEAQQHLDVLKRAFSPREEVWMLQGILAMQQENYDQAREAFEKALQFDGDARKARLGLGMAWMGQEKPEQAWGAFLHVLEQHPDDTDAVQWLLRAGTALRRWDDLAERLSSTQNRIGRARPTIFCQITKSNSLIQTRDRKSNDVQGNEWGDLPDGY